MTKSWTHLLSMSVLVVTSLAGPSARADGRGSMTELLPPYRQECAACHIAYPPGMLPASSWQRLLNGLPQHFGTDASLDPESVKQLSVWLTAHADRDGGTPPSQDRITRTAWFVHEHEEVPAASWKLPAVKSPANCAACHTKADQGDFSERHIRIPR